ncbi:MAG: carboxypeptidase-like regulatory domain-containing protein, partial [Terracidiphilus sp.]
MFRSLSKLVLVLMVLFFLGNGLAFAQNGSIKGQVTDPQGKAISGAAVQLVNPEGTFQRDTKTDASGQYSITDLPPGQYLVVVTADGFEIAATDSANPLVIAAGQALVHDQQITALKGVAESV